MEAVGNAVLKPPIQPQKLESGGGAGLDIAIRHRFEGGISLDLELAIPAYDASVTAIFGPSGCGKTTLLRTIAGFFAPAVGHVRFRRETWLDIAARSSVPVWRRGVGFVAAERSLFPHLTVLENISFGVRGSTAERARIAGKWLDRFGLQSMAGRRPGQLSRGEDQRIALARTLASQPRLVCLDEPLSGIDAPLKTSLRTELRQWLTMAKTPAILVSHDPLDVAEVADEVVVMESGRILQTGLVRDVFESPNSLEAACVLGFENCVLGGTALLPYVVGGHLPNQAFFAWRAAQCQIVREVPVTAAGAILQGVRIDERRNAIDGTTRVQVGPWVFRGVCATEGWTGPCYVSCSN